MTNVIELNAQDPVAQAERVLTEEIAGLTQERDSYSEQIRELTRTKIDLTVTITHTTDVREKKSLNADLKKIEARIKQLKEAESNVSERCEASETELALLQKKRNQAFVQATSQTAAERVFTEHNIHYVIFDQQWWSVDPAGDRMSVKINASEASVIKDLIYNDSNWEIREEQELKRLAKSMGRMYKHIVRDFNTQPRAGIYNQMTDIRRHWLQPISGVAPHPAFRLLTLSIAGGRDDYADQLERYVAYRYCHPEDVMIPNIDSCALGGTGRDTYFNLLSTIFTNECCGSAGEETFRGMHNGDLFGKMIVKVDEKNSNLVPIDKIKELTGATRYRHRGMHENARDAVRLFNFIFFRNGYTTTVKLAGTGSAGEDRRFEPIIARINLPRYVARHFNLIEDINQPLSDEQTRAMQIVIKDWQRDYYKNEQRISEWLGHIIAKFDATNMAELLPLHGVYYQEMLARQQRGLDGFMPKIFALMQSTTVLSIKDIHRIYEAAESVKITKDGFKNQLLYWLNSKMGWDAEVVVSEVYPWDGAANSDRRRITYIQNRLAAPARAVFDLEEFIDKDAVDDRGTTVGLKINQYSIRDELR